MSINYVLYVPGAKRGARVSAAPILLPNGAKTHEVSRSDFWYDIAG